MGAMDKRKKKFVLMVSQFFPVSHHKAGEKTGFVENVSCLFSMKNTKVHTIRSNYDLWKDRIEQINRGEGLLSIRYWSGKPYRSKQIEIVALDSVGIEKINISLCDNLAFIEDGKRVVDLYPISRNDGLSYWDFIDWFKGVKNNEPMALIHFTDFRYVRNEY